MFNVGKLDLIPLRLNPLRQFKSRCFLFPAIQQFNPMLHRQHVAGIEMQLAADVRGDDQFRFAGLQCSELVVAQLM